MRFPGFEGEWEEKKLGDLLEFKNGINASKEQYGTGVKFINVSDILKNDFITYDKITGKVDVDIATVEKYAVNYGDILFQRSSETRKEVGTANVYLDKENTATFGGFVIRGRKIGDYEPVFLNKLLQTSSAREDITSKSGGSTRYNVGQEILSTVALHFPNLKEQHRISSFLELIDNRINTQSKIIEELKLLHTLAAKNIFTKQLRFKNSLGENYPEWQIISLDEIGKTYNGLTGKTKDDFGVGKPYIQYKQIFDNSKIDTARCELVNIAENENQYQVKKGDVFFTVSSETPEEIGMSSVLLDDVEVMYLNSFCFGYRPNSTDILSPSFARYLFRSVPIRNKIIKLAQGSTRYNMSKISLMKLKVHLPCIEEQHQIANFLTSLDDKLSIEQNLLEKLKKEKQYLLSKLFI